MCLISEHVISRTAELNLIFYIRLCIKYRRSETLFHPYRNIFRLITMTVKSEMFDINMNSLSVFFSYSFHPLWYSAA